MCQPQSPTQVDTSPPQHPHHLDAPHHHSPPHYPYHPAPLDPPSTPDSDASDSSDDVYTPTSHHHSHHQRHHRHHHHHHHTPKRPFRTRDTLLHRTLTLYDWDDTFFPSTYLAERGVRIDEDGPPLPDAVAADLAALEDMVIKILAESLRCGVVKVITNAEEGWVELSGSRFMPRLAAFLTDNHIKVVSARTSYETDFPDSPACWKTAAFAAEVDSSFPDTDYLNVLVLGDSLSEREAAHNTALRRPSSCVKSIKLVERPNIVQLQRQIALLHGSFHDIREYFGSFDVNLQC